MNKSRQYIFVHDLIPKHLRGTDSDFSVFQAGRMYFDSLTDEIRKSEKIFENIVLEHEGIKEKIEYENKTISFVKKNLYSRIFKREKLYKSNFKNIIKNNELADEYILLISEITLPAINSALWFKKRYKNTKIILFVLDFPENVGITKANKIKKILKKVYSRIIEKKYKFIDGFVFFSPLMKDRFPINAKSCTIEAIFPDTISDIVYDRKKYIIFSGNISNEDYLFEFASCFFKLTKDIEFVVTGKGFTNKIAEKVNSDRFKLLGLVSLEELKVLQSNALVTVDVEIPTNENNSFFFPSKTIDYLVNNGVVAIHKFESIPYEYDKVFYYPKDNSLESLAILCADLCNLPKDKFIDTLKNRDDLISKKTALYAFEKIKKLIDD